MLRSGSLIHQKYSEKHTSFINELVKFVDNEENQIISDTIKAWISFSCIGFCFMAKMHKKENREQIKNLTYYAHLYKNNLLKNKLAFKRYKFIGRIGLKTWCKNKFKKNKTESQK